MGDKQPFLEWIVRTVIAAIFSVVGFLGQDMYSEWKVEQALYDLENLKASPITRSWPF